MSLALFRIFELISWIIALLPLRIQYLIADLLWIVITYIVRYRRKVVTENLKNAFPEKSLREISKIRRKFYRHFADLIIESNALQSLSSARLKERCKITNPELLDQYYAQGRSVILVLGHYGNWEWLSSVPLWVQAPCITIYKPLNNKFMGDFINRLRSRFGIKTVPMQHIYRELTTLKHYNIPSISFFLADQSPTKSQIRYWATFLNQPTGVFLGTEKMAIKLNAVIVFLKMNKVKRGYYEITFVSLFDDLTGIDDHTITLTHLKALEEEINAKPEFWLWSHRRWKHKPDVKSLHE
jgi:Kdo2-lipid IVA lauroyltransferase/acyltransferase